MDAIRTIKAMAYCLLLTMVLAGCKTKTVVVTVPEVRTDTIQITKQQRDSIWLHDSIFISEKQKDDTIYLYQERWHTKYIEKIKTDTIYEHKVDSVGVPYPVPKYVEKNLNWWQKTRMGVGSIALILLLCWCVWQAAKFYLRRF